MIQLGFAMIILAVLLFFVAFISKRRFGLLGLSLAAGSVLSELWSLHASSLMDWLGIARSSSLESIIGVSLIMLPALITLLHGYTYNSIYGRIFGSIAFAVLAVALLSAPLSYAFVNTGSMANFVTIFESYKDWIVGVGISIAVIDLLFSKPGRFSR